MSLVYTITSGYLECQNEKVKIPFALVFLENGVYRIEINLEDDSLYNKYQFNHYYKLIGITEKKYHIECINLILTRHEDYNSKIELISEGYVKLFKPQSSEDSSEKEEDRERIWMVELENLKTSFANFTHIQRSTDFGPGDDFFSKSILDHTETLWVINNLKNNGNYFKFRLIQKKNSENLLLDLRGDKGYCKLYYEEYVNLKKNLISLLSFMNGGIVRIRKEYTGKYYGQGDLGYHSQTEINYSFLKKYDDSYNDYLQINYHHSYSGEIFREIFTNCFDKFQQYNKILELDSLIFSLNVSTQTIGLKERYFILITAFEKIAKLHSNLSKSEPNHFIENEFFNSNIKPKLFDSILPIKSIDKNAWSRMNSILSNLNNNNSSTKSLFEFLIFAKIPISKSVERLVKKERNLAVHEGKIGEDDEDMFKTYLKIDHVLRDVILNLIGYFSKRNRKGLYATMDEFETANPKKSNENCHYIIK